MLAANPSKSTEEIQRLVAGDDGRDWEFAQRGFIATRKDPLIRGSGGRAVYDLSTYGFDNGAAPDTVNPSLWRQAHDRATRCELRHRDAVSFAENGQPRSQPYSSIKTVRATSPAFMARNASLTSSSLPRRVIMASRSIRPCR